MKKIKFIADRWIKFTLLNQVCIGKTTIFSPKKTGREINMVCLVTSDLCFKSVEFELCENVRYLEFIEKTLVPMPKLFNKTILDKRQTLPDFKKTISTLANSQISKINRN